MPGITPRTAHHGRHHAFRVSVVITTCGRMDLLDRCLDALSRQSLPGSDFELIVVDDEPNHNTWHLVAGWRARLPERGPRLLYLPNSNGHGPGAARNLGWRSAQAPIVAFTNEDTVPSPAWLAQGLAAFGDEVDVLCGRLDVRAGAIQNATQRATQRTTQRTARQAGTEPLCAANCFCRKTLLASLDGFDERFGQARHCDADFHFRLLGLGACVVLAPEAMVVQPASPARWGASLARTRDVVFDALLYKKHPQLYRERIATALPWEHYLAVTALLATLAAVLAGWSAAALAAGLAWLALTARLCRRRMHGARHSASQLADILLTSILVPPLTVFWRLAGALRYRVRFT